jgi:3-methyl-2-oxobutanoate hydroxymethyltransferase
MMRTTVTQIRDMKASGEKITMLTSYDYSTAQVVDRAGIPLILVGDSLGMVVLGYETTIPVTMEDMLHHTKAVVRGTQQALVVGDMPFMSYHVSTEEAMRNAARFIQEAGCQAVKLEGGATVAEKVRRIVEAGIPVMGHIGLTPQSVNQLGGHKLQGRAPGAAAKILEDARALEDAGVFSIVMESVPAPLATLVTERSGVPTIGIAAGPGCDGQVQIINDMLGSFSDFVPRHAKQYAQLAQTMAAAIEQYKAEVASGAFPTAKHSFTMDESLLDEFRAK